MYQATQTGNRKRKKKRLINKHQNKFTKGYMSVLAESRTPEDALSDLTNMEIVQNGVPRPRPPLVPYGEQTPEVRAEAAGTVDATNLITNPSIEVDATGYSAYVGASISQSALQNYVGGNSLQIANVASPSGGFYGGARYDVTGLVASQTYVASIWVYSATVQSVNLYVGAPLNEQTDLTTQAGVWERITVEFVAGDTTEPIYIRGRGASLTWYADALMVTAGTTVHDYFDGDTTDSGAYDYAWTGSVNASTSERTAFEYGPAEVIGRGGYKWMGERYVLFMLKVGGVGVVYKQKDGGAMTAIGGSFDASASWAGFQQSHGRVYIYNGINKLGYINLSTGLIVNYSLINAPTGLAAAESSLTGSAFTYYYRVTANNEVGESEAAAAVSEDVALIRDAWDGSADKITVTWNNVVGAVSYTVYMGDSAGNELELATVTGLEFVDDGTLAPNPFKLAPEGNSTEGPVLDWMYNDPRNAQVFGVSSVDNRLWYAAPGTGDFSPYNGGGWVAIDEDGDTELNYVDGFRDGKGNPVITVSARAAAGKGTLNHVTFATLTIGDQAIVYPNVYPANGQSGTYSARGVIKARDSLFYPTGDTFKSTGTSQNIVNILTTNTIAQVIEPDLEKINLENLHKSVGLEFRDKLFWALPVGDTENNEIWYMDLARKNLWVLRWPVPAKDMWLYEDNSGTTHFCMLVNGRILELTRAGSQTTQDDGVAFKTRVAFNSLVWDEDGLTMANIYRQYFKLLQPKGRIVANAYGLGRDKQIGAVGTDEFDEKLSASGWSAWNYSGDYKYGDDVGEIQIYAQSIGVLELKPTGLMNEMSWEVITEEKNADYMLSAVNTRGKGNDDLIYGV